MFPDNYDWRGVISSLLSPRDNPRHYWFAASGLALTAVLMLPFAEHLRRHLQSVAPRMAKMSAAAFTVGIVALISACFVVPQHVHETIGIRRLHELLGRTAADASQWRCCVGAGAHGMAALKTRPPLQCFGSGHS